MKDAFYFSHDYNATADPKIQALIGEYGAVGYGIYWRLVEMLHESESHKLELKKYIFIAISKQMSTSVEQVSAIVSDCINSYELFVSDGNFFFSDRVNRNIEKRSELSRIRSESGKKSAANRTKKTQTNVEQMLANAEQMLANAEQVSTNAEQNPTKERKGKEIKGKEIKENEIWRNNIDIYLHDCEKNFHEILSDHEFIFKQEKLNPGIDVRLSIEKAYENFWHTEAGWRHKKKSKIAEINWRLTFANAISLNKVYTPKGGIHDNQRQPTNVKTVGYYQEVFDGIQMLTLPNQDDFNTGDLND